MAFVIACAFSLGSCLAQGAPNQDQNPDPSQALEEGTIDAVHPNDPEEGARKRPKLQTRTARAEFDGDEALAAQTYWALALGHAEQYDDWSQVLDFLKNYPPSHADAAYAAVLTSAGQTALTLAIKKRNKEALLALANAKRAVFSQAKNLLGQDFISVILQCRAEEWIREHILPEVDKLSWEWQVLELPSMARVDSFRLFPQGRDDCGYC